MQARAHAHAYAHAYTLTSALACAYAHVQAQSHALKYDGHADALTDAHARTQKREHQGYRH